jgi:hypothetical protein
MYNECLKAEKFTNNTHNSKMKDKGVSNERRDA